MSKSKFSKFIAFSTAAAVVTTVAASGAIASSTVDYKDQASISSWAKDASAYLKEKGIMQGSNGAFSPQKAITRGEVAKIMAVSLGLVDGNKKLDVNVTTGFKDVDGQWFAPYIKLLLDYNKDILSGYEDGTFKPNQEIRRDELAKIIVIANKLELNNNVKVSFKDLKNNWAQKYIYILASNGIVIGSGDGYFNPSTSVTRESTAVFVHRTLEEHVRVPAAKNPSVIEIIKPPSNELSETDEDKKPETPPSSGGGDGSSNIPPSPGGGSESPVISKDPSEFNGTEDSPKVFEGNIKVDITNVSKLENSEIKGDLIISGTTSDRFNFSNIKVSGKLDLSNLSGEIINFDGVEVKGETIL